MKRYDFFESLRQRLPTLPRLNPVGIGTPLQFASSGGGGGDYDDPDDDYYEDYPEEPAPSRRGNGDRRPTAGRQRTVQSEPDDRYWTDYLRIALPVIGLLLVIAVFWFWAQQLIDDPDEDVTPTEPGLAEVVDDEPTEAPDEAAATPTPTTDQEGNGEEEAPPPTEEPEQEQPSMPTPTPPAETDTGGDTQDAEGDQGQDETGTDNQVPDQGDTGGEEQQPEEPADNGGIAPDTTVTVTEDLNLRSGPTTQEENVVTTLDAGTELTVLSGPEEAEGYTWWEVLDEATSNQGYVVEDFIEPAG